MKNGRRERCPGTVLRISLLLLFLAPAAPAAAYIGPGAGFAFVSTFFIFIAAFFLALTTILTWPFRRLLRALSRKKRGRGSARRVVVLGFDGQDPEVTDRFMKEGILPNFSRLRDVGGWWSCRLQISCQHWGEQGV